MSRRSMVIEILTSRVGVPSFVDDDGSLVTLTNEEEQNLTAAILSDPTLAERLTSVIRFAVEEIAGIDASLSDGDWWFQFNNALAINALTTPLHVLARARMNADRILEDSDE